MLARFPWCEPTAPLFHTTLAAANMQPACTVKAPGSDPQAGDVYTTPARVSSIKIKEPALPVSLQNSPDPFVLCNAVQRQSGHCRDDLGKTRESSVTLDYREVITNRTKRSASTETVN